MRVIKAILKETCNRLYRHMNKWENPDYCWKLRMNIQTAKPFHRIISLYKWKNAIKKYGASIPLETVFKGKPAFPHGFYGVFISSGAKIGENCVIFHQVTIGSNTLPNTKHPGAPTIGDNVYIGAGAKIIGGVQIGNNVRIGANCVVTEDIPDNCTVVLVSPRYIEHQNIVDNQFIAWSDFL